MSYTVTKFVLDLDGLTPSEKAVALSFAYHAHADGTESYPKMETVAAEAGLKGGRRCAQRIVRQLEEKGVLIPETTKRGGRNKSTHYRFNLNSDSRVAVYDKETATTVAETATIDVGNSDIQVHKQRLPGRTKGPERTEREERGERKNDALSLAPSEREVEVNELCARLYGLGRPAPPFTGKHREKVGRLLGTYSADDLCEAYRQFVTDLDAFQLRNAPKHFVESAADIITAMRSPKARVLSASECTRLQRVDLWPLPPGLSVKDALERLKEKESERSKNAAPEYGDAMAILRAQRERLGMKLPDQPTKFVSQS